VEAAWRWTQARGLSADDELSYMNETAHLTLARVLLAQNRLDEAVRLLTRLRSAAEAAGRMGRVIEILAVLALALQARGETGQALAVLEQALALAEPEGYVRVFVDEGEAMREVIRQWGLEIRRQKRNGGEAKLNRLLVYADKLLAAFPDRTPQSPTSTPQSLPLLEPLSEREIEILRFIAAGMSNQEIAQRLVVALSTIQWHIKNVYGKLNVHSRTQAVARARELGLLT
jgi:LuxR family maltose regulon positive regulatory protein